MWGPVCAIVKLDSTENLKSGLFYFDSPAIESLEIWIKN